MTKKCLLSLCLVGSLLSLTGCSRTERELKSNVVEYPYRVEANTLTNVGFFSATLLDSNTFMIDNIKYTETDGVITEMELPKTTEDTKENFNDNIINAENLAKWEVEGDLKYERYSGVLERANVYLNIINNIENMSYYIEDGAVNALEEPVMFNGETCKVIRQEAKKELAAEFSIMLGGDGVPHIEKSEEPVVFITYYINPDGKLVYVSAEASEYMGRAGVRFEVYKDGEVDAYQ